MSWIKQNLFLSNLNWELQESCELYLGIKVWSFLFLEKILKVVWEEIMDQKKKEALRKEKKILGKRRMKQNE